MACHRPAASPRAPVTGPLLGCLSTTWVSGEGTELGLGSAEPLHPLASGKCLQPDARSSELLELPLPQPGWPAQVF